MIFCYLLKGIIISHKELVELFSFNETNVILGYGYFDYCIGKDFIISEKAFNLYKKKNE